MFRDAKCGQFGWTLEKTRITRPERLDGLLLIFLLAYLLLIGVGLWCRRDLPAKTWASNNRRTEFSALPIGRHMLNHPRLSLKQILIELAPTCPGLGKKLEMSQAVLNFFSRRFAFG